MSSPLRRRRPQARILALAFTAKFASAPGQSFLLAVFVEGLLTGTDLSRTTLSALYALATVSSAALVLGLGRAADRIGLRVLWAAVALGLAAACALASVAAGIVTAFVALALLRAFGQGSFPLVGTLLVARTFRGRPGQAMALASFGVTSAMIALPPLVALLVVLVGWRQAYQLLGLSVLLLILPLSAAIPPAFSRRAAAEQERPPRVKQAGRNGRSNPGAATLLLVLSTPSLIGTAVVFHSVALLGERGIPLAAAAAALSLYGAAVAAGTLAAGFAVDRGSTRVLLATIAGLSAAGTSLLLLEGAAAAYAAFVALGLSSGFAGVLGGVVWARGYGLTTIGALQGTSASARIGAAALGPLPLALAVGLSGDFTLGVAALAAFALFALAAAVRWQPPAPMGGVAPLAVRPRPR